MNREEILQAVKEGASLCGANLQGADLRGAYLQGADLRGADLYRASLYRANLQGANLQGAYLHEANLQGANLQGADLQGANLNYSCLPLWCGGTRVKVDRHLSLQLIYHAFNQDHRDEEIKKVLEPLRVLAEEFRQNHREDAPELWRSK